jgi:hypothetical protein
VNRPKRQVFQQFTLQVSLQGPKKGINYLARCIYTSGSLSDIVSESPWPEITCSFYRHRTRCITNGIYDRPNSFATSTASFPLSGLVYRPISPITQLDPLVESKYEILPLPLSTWNTQFQPIALIGTVVSLPEKKIEKLWFEDGWEACRCVLW